MGIVRDWHAYTDGAQGIPAKTGRTLRTVLGQMYKEALAETCGCHAEAEVKLAEAIDNDRRFDAYKTDKVVDRFRDCYSNGIFFDLEDPVLKGGAPRPGGLIGRSVKL
jgi:hypothetical protein